MTINQIITTYTSQTVTHKRDRRVVMVIKYLKKEIKWTIIVYQKVKDYFFLNNNFVPPPSVKRETEEKRRKKKTQKKKQKTKKKPKQYI